MTTEEWMNRAGVLDAEIYRLQNEYLDVMIQLVNAISQLPDRLERIILYSYYCNGKTWQAAADELGVSLPTIYRWRNHALQHMEEIIQRDR